jgi:hypothetical protein
VAGSEFPAGWYPDPADGARLRWWDGRRWTSHRHVPGDVAGAAGQPTRRWTRQQVVAASVLGGFIVLTAGIVLSLVLADDGPSDDLAIEDVLPPEDRGADGAGPADADTGPEDREAGAGDPEDPDAPAEDRDLDADGWDDADAEAGADGDTDADPADPDGDDGADADADADRDLASGGGDDADGRVALDGGCRVDLGDRDPDDVRAWELDECSLAPVEVGGPSGSWIVVVASFTGDALTEDEARSRADALGHELLWSSHYPSLNPDLWVVFDGPYADEDAAEAAADALGGGSYARVVSDDDGDRYCIAADGCVGGDPS